MNTSIRFLLLVILGIAIAFTASHLLSILVTIGLIFVNYALPLLLVLALLILGWRLVLSAGKADPEHLPPDKPTRAIIDQEHLKIERELRMLKHQINQINKKN